MPLLMLLIFVVPTFAQASVPFAAHCETILRADPKQHPMDGEAMARLLHEVWTPKQIGKNRELLPLRHPRVQNFIKQHSPHFDKMARKPASRLQIVDEAEHSPALMRRLREDIGHELNKVPDQLLRISEQTGRSFYMTMGPITLFEELSFLRGVVPRGWTKSWDHIPGCGGGWVGAAANAYKLSAGVDSHGAESLVIHEVLHNVDYAFGDWTGKPLSQQPEFLRRWRETEFRKVDAYMKSYPSETFAEFGDWYFHSDESREKLRDLYPAWFDYFERLSTQFGH